MSNSDTVIAIMTALNQQLATEGIYVESSPANPVLTTYTAAEVTGSPTATTTAKILLYSDGESYAGNLGSRSETNGICAGLASDLSITCTAHAALLSYGASDHLKYIPATRGYSSALPVYSTSDLKIANSWAGMFEVGPNVLERSLIQAGVLSAPSQGFKAFHTGSTAAGTFASLEENCNAWTSDVSDQSYMTNVGNAGDRSNYWVSYDANVCDGTTLDVNISTQPYLICACLDSGE